MMESHQINIGTSLSSHYQRLLDQHSSRVEQFLLSCHPYEGLRYLLRHLIETTNSRGSSKIDSTGTNQQQDPIQRSKLDKLFDEIEDIYYYVRTGRFPSHFRSLNSLPSTDRNPFPDRQLILHKACVLTPINSPNIAGAHCDKCSEKNTELYADGSGFTSSTQNRSASWNDLHNSENKPPVPPLPMRVYLNVHHQCDKSPVIHRPERNRSSLPVVNNPSYDQSIHSAIHLRKLSENVK